LRRRFLEVLGVDAEPETVQFESEYWLGEDGRVDMRISWPGGLILLESKFNASLQTNQLSKYLHSLKDVQSNGLSPESRIQRKKLVLLAPKHRIPSLVQESGLSDRRETNDISFEPVPWHKVVNILHKENELQRELRRYIVSLLPPEFNDGDRQSLSNAQVPKSLESLYTYISSLRNLEVFEELGLSTKGLGHSWNWYGFKAERKSHNYQIWIGMILEPWAEHEVPLFIQFRGDWVSTVSTNPDLFRQSLAGCRFQYDKRHGYDMIRPLGWDEIENLKAILVDIINRLDSCAEKTHIST